MKCVVVMFIVCSAMSSMIGGITASPTALGDELSEDTRICTMSGEDDDDSRRDKLVEKMMACITEGIDQVDNLTTLEEHRQFFNTYCSKLPKFNTCLQGVNDTAGMCLTSASQLGLHVGERMFMSIVNTGCEHNGENFAQFFNGVKEHDDEEIVMRRCVRTMTENVNSITTTPGAQRMLARYQNLKGLKDCLLKDVGNDNEDFATSVRAFLDNLARDMMCVDARDITLVPCSSIQNNDG